VETGTPAPTRSPDPGVDPFAADAAERGGYQYTGDRLSSSLANERMTEVELELCEAEGRRVIDIGCGDGTYTLELGRRARPAAVIGLDPATEAVEVARKRAAETGAENVTFATGSAYELPHEDGSFDVAVLRGVLHHVDDPQSAIGEALRVARRVVVLEPNGYNAGLKLLERVSRYHREHGEKSYSPRSLDRWVTERGGTVVERRFLNFVPMFCPDWYARLSKRVEPLIEGVPGLRQLGAAQYAFAALAPSS
jgi:ubiquinone/menaquinone biosynthesis C-methylase UbiE